LREYANVLKTQYVNTEVSLEEKIEWLLEKADWLDPLVNKEDPILGKNRYELVKKIFDSEE